MAAMSTSDDATTAPPAKRLTTLAIAAAAAVMGFTGGYVSHGDPDPVHEGPGDDAPDPAESEDGSWLCIGPDGSVIAVGDKLTDCGAKDLVLWCIDWDATAKVCNDSKNRGG